MERVSLRVRVKVRVIVFIDTVSVRIQAGTFSDIDQKGY